MKCLYAFSAYFLLLVKEKRTTEAVNVNSAVQFSPSEDKNTLC